MEVKPSPWNSLKLSRVLTVAGWATRRSPCRSMWLQSTRRPPQKWYGETLKALWMFVQLQNVSIGADMFFWLTPIKLIQSGNVPGVTRVSQFRDAGSQVRSCCKSCFICFHPDKRAVQLRELVFK